MRVPRDLELLKSGKTSSARPPSGGDQERPRLRFALYARVSTGIQLERDLSVPDQLNLMRAHVSGLNGTAVREFVDAGTGTNDKRESLEEMFDLIEADELPVDVILVHSLSRIFRESFLFQLYRRKAEAKGITIKSVTEDFGTGETADLMQLMIAVMAEWQSKENSKHVKRTRKANAAEGYYNGGITPYGYESVVAKVAGDRVRKRLEILAEEARVVRLIYKLRLEGDGHTGPLGTFQIVEWLNENGERARGGKLFYSSLTHRILSDPVYAGKHLTNVWDTKRARIRPEEESVLTEVPSIITEEIFWQVRAMMIESRPTETPPRRTKSDVLLGNLARCASCNGLLTQATGTSHTGTVYDYYVCSARVTRGRKACKAPVRVRRDILDEAVTEAICQNVLTPERVREIVRRVAEAQAQGTNAENAELDRLHKSLASRKRELSNLYDAVLAGQLRGSAGVRARQDSLEEQIEASEAKIRLAERRRTPLVRVMNGVEARRQVDHLRTLLKRAPVQTRKRYLQAVVSDVLVGPEGFEAVGEGDKLAEVASDLEGARVLNIPRVQSSDREWRCCQSKRNKSPPARSRPKPDRPLARDCATQPARLIVSPCRSVG
jgi:site-specific DNA recombinase